MAVAVKRHEGVAEVELVGAWMISSPRRFQSAWMARTASASAAVNAISPPPPLAVAAGVTVWRDHNPSMCPLSSANIAKVGEDSTGGRPSKSE